MADLNQDPLARPSVIHERLADAWTRHRRDLFGLCYRMTGSAADAEDLVQETFARALSKPPPDLERSLSPWLTRVAVNLSRDHLRRRRRGYDGPWLPEPLVSEPTEERAHEPTDTQGRYELLESISYAFLLALEELTPSQRAVLLLRDVFAYTGPETAAALDMSESNVRQTLRRARRTMADYERGRVEITPELCARTRTALERFLGHLAAGDVAGVEQMLAEDVVMLTDGGGVYHAARVPVMGRSRVARFHMNVRRAEWPRLAFPTMNGLPAVVGEYDHSKPGIAPRFVTLGWPDADGRISRIFTVLAPAKLVSVAKVEAGAPAGGPGAGGDESLD